MSGSRDELHWDGGDGEDSLKRRGDFGRANEDVAGPVDFWDSAKEVAADGVVAVEDFCGQISRAFRPVVEDYWLQQGAAVLER